MSDPVTPTPAPPMPPSSANTQAALQELANDVSLIKKVIADAKTGGLGAVIADAPQIIPEIQKDIAAVTAAIPEIKVGYKTTEFWLTVGVVAGNIVYTTVTGKAFPLEVNAVLVAVTTIYTVVRSLIKKQATTAAVA